MEQTTTIAELRAGSEIEGVFACTRKDRLTARSGSPYLAVELRDRTGAIQARAFREADFLAGQFERGDLVAVTGRVERFRDELQVELRSIRRAEAADPAAFLPTAYRDLDELDGFLEHLAREVYDPDLRALLDAFLGDDELPRRAAPGALHARRPPRLPRRPARAHGRRGTLALETCVLHPRLNSDVLICRGAAARRRQAARVRAGRGDRAQRGRAALVGHVALGQQMIVERAARPGRLPRREAARAAALRARPPRRRRAAGPALPLPEALALQRLNALDAAVKGALEHGLD